MMNRECVERGTSEIKVALPHKDGYGQIARWKDGKMAVESDMVIWLQSKK